MGTCPGSNGNKRRVSGDGFAGRGERAGRHRAEHAGALLRLLDQAGGAAADLLALVVPVDCVCCGAEDRDICVFCDRQIRRLTRIPFRAEGGAPALVDVDGDPMLPVVAAGVYREELAQAILSFKRHGQYQLRGSLGRALAGAIGKAISGDARVFLVPVPTSNQAFLKRGFSPVQLLLSEVSGQLPGLAVHDVLRKTGAGGRQFMGGQKGLGRGGRARVRHSMSIRQSRRHQVAGHRCIIIDDVLTTGATLAEAARALDLAGAVVTGAVVLAATRPPDPTGPGTASADAGRSGDDLEKNKPRRDE